MKLFEKCYNYTEAKKVMATGYYPYFVPIQETMGTEVKINGNRLIMIGSNNYLGLTNHPKVIEAAEKALERYGSSCTGSRFLNGTLDIHEKLEEELAEFMGKDAVLVFSTGFQTNQGTITALVKRNDYVIIDKEDHASIVDGCLLTSGKMLRYKHSNMDDLEKQLASIEDEEAGKLVVVDGVFSMGGEIADLPHITQLCKKYDVALMVDDAHSVGVLGEGRGTAAHFGLTDKVDLTMGTFSKSFASLGGFIAGSETVIHYIKHHSRALIFSASMPPANVATARAALNLMQTEKDRIHRLWEIAEFMKREFDNLGFDTGNTQTPIIPIFIRDNMKTFQFWKELFQSGIFVNPIISPAVPPNQSMLRTSYMATHTDEQLEIVLETFEKVGKKYGVI